MGAKIWTELGVLVMLGAIFKEFIPKWAAAHYAQTDIIKNILAVLATFFTIKVSLWILLIAIILCILAIIWAFGCNSRMSKMLIEKWEEKNSYKSYRHENFCDIDWYFDYDRWGKINEAKLFGRCPKCKKLLEMPPEWKPVIYADEIPTIICQNNSCDFKKEIPEGVKVFKSQLLLEIDKNIHTGNF